MHKFHTDVYIHHFESIFPLQLPPAINSLAQLPISQDVPAQSNVETFLVSFPDYPPTTLHLP